MLLPCQTVGPGDGGGDTPTFNALHFSLTDQKKSSSLSVTARQKPVIKRWNNFLRINILSFTSCCNETITDNQSGRTEGRCLWSVYCSCLYFISGPHTSHHTTPPSSHPASQHFFSTVGYFPSGLPVGAWVAAVWPTVLLDAWDDTISLGGGLALNYRRDQAALITGPDTPHSTTLVRPG